MKTWLGTPYSLYVLSVNQRLRSGVARDRGASSLEYAGLVVLAALLVSALISTGLVGGVARGTGTALCRIFASQSSCAPASPPPTSSGRDSGGQSPRASQESGNPIASFARGVWANVTHYGPDGQPLPDQAPKQTIDFFKGAVETLVDTARDTVDLVLHPEKAVSQAFNGLRDRANSYARQAVRQWRNGDYFGAAVTIGEYSFDSWWNSPVSVGGIVNAFVDDKTREYWREGQYGKAAGRVFGNVALLIDPGTWATKLGPLSKVGRVAENAGKVLKGSRLATAARAAKQAAGRAVQAARRGDLKTARREAAEARRRANEAKQEARKRGCKTVSLGPLHIGGRFSTPLKPKRNNKNKNGATPETNPCETAKAAERDAKNAENAAIQRYIQAPPQLNQRFFPNTKLAPRKTPVQGGGGLRKRWKDNKGQIYEWDSQHGKVEKYTKRGKHLGEYDPNTGQRTKPPDPSRTVVP